jgi:DNA-binding response OmpR family regulator
LGKGGPQAKRLGKASRSPIPSSADGSARCCAEPSTPPPALVSRVGSLTVNHAARDVRLGDRQVELAPKEFELLRTLIADPTRVFTREELMADVWGYAAPGRSRTLDSHASRLRRKLCGDGHDKLVVNVWGVGYRLVDGATIR